MNPAVILRAQPEYLEAFGTIMRKIAASVGTRDEAVVVCVCGGAALHLYTGTRVSKDIDAAILAKFIPPPNLHAAYKGTDGHARMLYFDTQFNGNFSLLHPDAYKQALPIRLEGVNPMTLDLRLLSPVDLAVSKLGRFGPQDQEDLRALAKRGLVDGSSLRARAIAALPGYVGDVDRLRESIETAANLVSEATLH